MKETLTLEFDGGSRGNPGPAGYGVVIRAKDGTELLTYGNFIGHATNNVAEYHGLINAMRKALDLGARIVRVVGDSELVIKQMTGEYRVRNEGLRPLYAQASALAAKFDSITFKHVRRESNELADKLYNKAISRRGEVHDVDE
ncbi:MAG: ribonuclease HI family protein [Tepidisphaeraceae bacterium]